MKYPFISLGPILLVAALGGGCGADRPASDGTDSTAAATGAGRDEMAGAPALAAVVDATSLEHKMLFGYQGWFLGRGDGSPVSEWKHWFRDDAPTAANLTIDMWPDTSELGADELLATGLAYPYGSVARLYSAYNGKTVARHFAWMKEAGIDGVALQRFLSEVQDPRFFAARNQVTRNVQAGAEAEGAFRDRVRRHGRRRGAPRGVARGRLEVSRRHAEGHDEPALPRGRRQAGAVPGGLGFSDRPGTPAAAAALIDWFTKSADPRYRVTLVGGVPTHWRTLDGDAKRDPAWAPVYRAFDVLSPWTVGRFRDDAEADAYRATLAADLAEVTAAGKRYMPVVFPGFSWHNLHGGRLEPHPAPRR